MFSRNKYLVVFMAILAAAGVFYGGFFFGQNQKPPNGKGFNIINQKPADRRKWTLLRSGRLGIRCSPNMFPPKIWTGKKWSGARWKEW